MLNMLKGRYRKDGQETKGTVRNKKRKEKRSKKPPGQVEYILETAEERIDKLEDLKKLFRM